MKHTVESTIGVLQNAGAPDPIPEWPFAEALGRGWRFDYAWPDCALCLAWEIEGVLHGKGGRHQRPEGLAEDARKYNTAALMGWKVIRTTQRQVETGEAALWLLAALGLGAIPANATPGRTGSRRTGAVASRRGLTGGRA